MARAPSEAAASRRVQTAVMNSSLAGYDPGFTAATIRAHDSSGNALQSRKFAIRRCVSIVRPLRFSGACSIPPNPISDRTPMFITPAFAQGAPAGGGTDVLFQMAPFLLIFVIMYFLILRPQQKRVKEHQAMVKALRKGDTVVTSGGVVGKVTKVIDDNE